MKNRCKDAGFLIKRCINADKFILENQKKIPEMPGIKK
jgi:hypothetical protein